jgi:hypothetical protein
VGLRAPAVVRLEGALAHVRLSVVVRPARGIARGRLVVQATSTVASDRCCPTTRVLGDARKRPRTASTHHPSRGRESSRSSLRRGAMTVKHHTPGVRPAPEPDRRGGCR